MRFLLKCEIWFLGVVLVFLGVLSIKYRHRTQHWHRHVDTSTLDTHLTRGVGYTEVFFFILIHWVDYLFCLECLNLRDDCVWHWLISAFEIGKNLCFLIFFVPYLWLVRLFLVVWFCFSGTIVSHCYHLRSRFWRLECWIEGVWFDWQYICLVNQWLWFCFHGNGFVIVRTIEGFFIDSWKVLLLVVWSW